MSVGRRAVIDGCWWVSVVDLESSWKTDDSEGVYSGRWRRDRATLCHMTNK
jgi:hypothetical protein